MTVNYQHSDDIWKLDGARVVLACLFATHKPQSILDVGCGPGTWLAAALEMGITDLIGLEGVDITSEMRFVPDQYIRLQDLTTDWNVARRFDIALCLEVAEHLDACHSDELITKLTAHANTVVFAAAIPGQPGYHHVNCQWPAYWQARFNACGFACYDTFRWQIWQDTRIEPWYRQNLFIATAEPSKASHEERIRPVIHPDMLRYLTPPPDPTPGIKNGDMQTGWYFHTLVQAMAAKTRRRVSRIVRSINLR